MIHSLAISDCSGSGSPYPLKGDLIQCMDHAKRLGYDGVELHARNVKYNDYHKLAYYADKFDIKVTAICPGSAAYYDGHYLVNEDKQALKEAQNVFIDFIKAGSILGGLTLSLSTIKGGLPDPLLRDSYKNQFYENLLPLVDAAEKYNCVIAIEAANRFQTPYLCSTEETLEFVNRFDSDRVKIHLDTFHMNIEDPDLPAAIIQSKDRLGYFHFSDSDRCYPGHGHINYKEIVDALYEAGFMENGVGGHEYFADPDGVTAALRGLAHIKQFMR